MKSNHWILLGATMAALGVVAGAFGAHWLEAQTLAGLKTARQVEAFKTAAHYQLIHAIGLIVLGLFRPESRAGRMAGYNFVAGIILFSGSIYLWVLAGAAEVVRIVPAGGLAFIVGWCALAVAAYQQQTPSGRS